LNLRTRKRVTIHAWQVIVLAALLVGWEWVPQLPHARDVGAFLDPFFISSPSRVAAEVRDLLTGAHDTPTIWKPLRETLQAALIGIGGGTVVGAAVGLLLSNSDMLYRVFTPFITALNAMPRIALIPIWIIILGPTENAASAAAAFLVVFSVFFNALEGARSISRETVQNARILGTGRMGIIFRVRFPYMLAWVFAALPAAVGFGLGATITTELLTGVSGLGGILSIAINSVQATLTFATVVVISVCGVTIVVLLARLRRQVLHWWDYVASEIE
jgi:NitT/TauT family transport system permease protein